MGKSNKIWFVIVIILLVLVGALGFFLGKKLATKDDNKKESTYTNMIDFSNQKDRKEDYEYTLENGKYAYKFKGIADKGIEVDGHMIFEGSSIVSAIGVMDNGMIVIDYQGVEVQYGYIRLYFDNNYKQVKRVEGVPFNTGLLAKSYKFNPPSDECVDGNKVIKTYELKIEGTNITDELVNTSKEEGCAGVV